MYSQTNSADSINKIGAVACTEFSFEGLSSATAISVSSSLAAQFSKQDLLAYVNQKSLNGLTCNGNETSLKDCKPALPYDLNMPLFELKIECSCKLN